MNGDRFRVVLAEPRNPLNIGAAARAMSNFAFSDLRLVNPYDVAFREARSAVHAQFVLEKAQVYTAMADALADCSLVVGTTAGARRDLHLPLYRLEAGASLIRERWAEGGNVALLFGSEKFGLSNEQISYCHWLLRIPTEPSHDSMNLGQAVAVCLYELRREQARASERFSEAAPLTGAEAERLTVLLHELLERSGYVQERTAGSAELKLRRLIRRLGVTSADADTWVGMFRQILWKIKQSGPR